MAISLFSIKNTFGQEKSPVKFGKVTAADFDLSKYKFDTSVSAVVIADIGSSQFVGNSKALYTLIFKHQKRIKILTRNGFDAASIAIPLYSTISNEEKLSDLKAYTYNLENGAVIKTELESNAIFKDKLSKNYVKSKFTFPAVKEGSIIEYSYTIYSDFLFNLQPWIFQGKYPRIWSEYNVSLPVIFNYAALAQGYQPYFIKEQSQRLGEYNVTIPGETSANEYNGIGGKIVDFRWVMKDVPALKEEGFTSTLNNHIAKIEFQLSQYHFPDKPVKDIMGTWQTVSEKLMQDDYFGATLNYGNNWLNADMKEIISGADNELEKAKRIYAFLRDNFTCSDYSDLYLNDPLKTIFKNKNGSVSDINLLLVAMLHHEKIEADPVILSTRDNGFPHDEYPLINKFNYVIVATKIMGRTFYLDASHSFLAFGKLPAECYNGNGRIIAKHPFLISFIADSLKEAKVTSVIITSDNGKMEGSFKTTLGYYESLNTRKKIKDKGEAEFFKKIRSAYNSDIEITASGFDSLKIIEQPLSIHYDFKLNDMEGDIIYFNPMMGEGFKDNFFKAAERKYPVEMPYTFDETYILNMTIPDGYAVDEIPKSAKVSFNEGEGLFEYMINKSGSDVQLRSRIVMKRANFAAEEYKSLRDFFGYVVKKHSEQIVLKKKK